MFGGFNRGPEINVEEAVERGGEAIIFGEGADMMIEKIREIGLIDRDRRDIFEPGFEKSGVFCKAERGVGIRASSKKEIVD